MSVPSVIAEKPEAVTHALHGDHILAILHEMLPAGSALAVSWRDWSLGSGSVVAPFVAQELRSQAERALNGPLGISLAVDGLSLVHAWDSQDGSARLALVVSAPAWLGDAECQAWLKMAATLVDAVFASARAQTRIVKLEKSKRLQQALFEIAELAGADMDMQDMLRRIHAVIGSLLYAENCYIALFDDERQTVRYLYYSDRLDPYVADPWREWTDADMPDSLTFAVLRHGQPMRGPSKQVRRRLGVPYNPVNGQESADWLGVPMHSDKRVRGLVVVQHYEQANVYGDEERVLLSYVAQHVLTALERRHAHEDLERRIEIRTDELRKANRELMSEIIERERAEELQQALFRITELAVTSESLERFYANVHAVVDELIYARNFYIALLSDDGRQVDFPYCVDMRQECMAYYRREPVAGDDIVKQLAEHAAQQAKGAPAHSWLGAPLYSDGKVVGVVAVQSYTAEVSFSTEDQDLLSFVAHHIGNGLARQRADERLRRMHAELEQRVEERTHELARVNASLRVEIDERQRAEQRLIRQATHDGLTGLPNRLHLLERLSTEIRRARYGDGDSFAVLFLDLDRFKLVNDSVGHDAGDSLLNEVARRITSAVSSNGTVARLGGDEFVVVSACPEGNADSACELARHIQKVLNAPLRIAGRELYPSASIGIAVWNPSYRNGDELLRDADTAMYYAKSEGRAHWAIFDASMRELATRKLELEADMRRAIERRSFVPFYQPIRRLQDGRRVGHEALIRWQHETRGLLLPGEFLSVGEESGLIEQADWQIYRQVAMRLAHAGSGYVSINVSPRHLGQPDFSERLLAMLASMQADASRLRLEITEMALLDDAPSTRRSLQALHENGVRIFLDDFGTGYSALSYLHRFPISALKIDRSFVAGLGNGGSPESHALVRAIVAMANSLSIETVAEGVETEAQLEALQAIGCTCVQGYLIGRPAADIQADTGTGA